MKKFFLLSFLFLFFPISLSATMSGGEFEIYADSVSTIEGGVQAGGAFTLEGNIEDYATPIAGGGGFELRSGFIAQERGILSFTLESDNINFEFQNRNEILEESLNFTVSTDSETGYAVSISENQDLTHTVNNAEIFSDVDDGEVGPEPLAGQNAEEEYGIRVQGNDAIAEFTNADNAITQIPQIIVSSQGNGENAQSSVLFRAISNNQTLGGNYTHQVNFTVTVNP